MHVTRVALSNFRNYAQLDLEPALGLNVFLGANAQGKSNLLEAIAMLGTGKSFRTAKEADLIREGVDLAVVGGDARIRSGALHLGCTLARGSRGMRKNYTVNGQSVRYARFLGSIKVVTFVPSDLQLVAGPPSLRRGFLNMALAQEERMYYHEFVRYQKALQQKAAMLRGSVEFDPELLAIYDHAMVEAGTQVMLARNHFSAALAKHARQIHADWTAGEERLTVRYAPNVPFEVPTSESVAAAFASKLREVALVERARRTTLVGPHRDDMVLELGGASLAAYGSQGQQRTAVLALKVGEYHVMSDRSGEAPLLLLDDVLSELDQARAAAFLDGVSGYEQAFVTATHLPPGLPTGAHISTIERATVRACAAC